MYRKFKTQIDPNDTVNSCNQFLIVKLLSKIKTLQARGLSDNTFAYKKAISSIKRYPMPLVCRSQLQSINGLGQKLCDQLQKCIKTHYLVYLNRNLQQKDPIYGSENLSTETIRSSSLNMNRIRQNENNVQIDNNEDTKSVKSVVIGYKPRVNTINAYFLQSLSLLCRSRNNPESEISKQDLAVYMEANFSSVRGKNWKSIQNILLTNGYINIINKPIQNNFSKKQQQNKFYQLTQKGQSCVESLNQKTKVAASKSKMNVIVNSFKSDIAKSNSSLNGQEQSYKRTPEQKQNQLKLQDLFIERIQQNEFQDQPKSNLPQLELIIDSRQRNDKAESCYFQQKIAKKYQIKCRMTNLSIGDFIWVYDNKVLNYIIERKKADDLASSILDGRYKDQKYRLKNCGIQNIFYLYQGHPSDNCCRSQKQLNNALLKTRVKEGFKIIKTNDVNESLRFLNSMHQQIQRKISNGEMKYLGTIKQFNSHNSVQKNLTVQKIFGLGLMTIPGLGKNGVTTLINYFKTYRSMFEYLRNLQSNLDRTQFLKGLFKGKGISLNIPKTIVNILFFGYPNSEPPCSMKQNSLFDNIPNQSNKKEVPNNQRNSINDKTILPNVYDSMQFIMDQGQASQTKQQQQFLKQESILDQNKTLIVQQWIYRK